MKALILFSMYLRCRSQLDRRAIFHPDVKGDDPPNHIWIQVDKLKSQICPKVKYDEGYIREAELFPNILEGVDLVGPKKLRRVDSWKIGMIVN